MLADVATKKGQPACLPPIQFREFGTGSGFRQAHPTIIGAKFTDYARLDHGNTDFHIRAPKMQNSRRLMAAVMCDHFTVTSLIRGR
jgi:hypothetical protein